MPAEPTPETSLKAKLKTEPFRLRRLIPLAAIAAVAILVVAMGWHRELSLENLVRYRTALDGFVTAYGLGAIAAFVAVYIAVVALSIPGALYLTITSGILFGTVAGAVASVIGATVGATVIFLIAKTAFGEYLLRRAGPTAARLAEGFRENAFSYLLFLRIVPFPFSSSIWLRRWPACGSARSSRRLRSASCRRRSRWRSSAPGSTARSWRRRPCIAHVSRRAAPTARSISTSRRRSRRS